MAEPKKEVAFRKHALVAIYEVFDYIANDSEANAIRFINELKFFIQTLPDFPKKFPECRELPTKNRIYRSVVFGNYRIIDKISEKIEILDIFNTKRNPVQIKKLRRAK